MQKNKNYEISVKTLLETLRLILKTCKNVNIYEFNTKVSILFVLKNENENLETNQKILLNTAQSISLLYQRDFEFSFLLNYSNIILIEFIKPSDYNEFLEKDIEIFTGSLKKKYKHTEYEKLKYINRNYISIKNIWKVQNSYSISSKFKTKLSFLRLYCTYIKKLELIFNSEKNEFLFIFTLEPNIKNLLNENILKLNIQEIKDIKLKLRSEFLSNISNLYNNNINYYTANLNVNSQNFSIILTDLDNDEFRKDFHLLQNILNNL